MPEVTNSKERPEFASWLSYREFETRVRNSRRYVWGDDIHNFLDTVLQTGHKRETKIPSGTILWRAQIGVEYDPMYDPDGNKIQEQPIGFSAERMKPISHWGKEGRANSAGIPVLYVASTEQIAISEVRPWIGSEISVARLRLLRELTAIDLSLGHGKSTLSALTWPQFLGDEAPNAETKERAVWTDIDNAFSRPITLTENTGGYVSTQILSELFLNAGYDAVIYGSQFGDGFNIAVFDMEEAEVINCTPYSVSGIEVKYQQAGNTWFKVDSV